MFMETIHIGRCVQWCACCVITVLALMESPVMTAEPAAAEPANSTAGLSLMLQVSTTDIRSHYDATVLPELDHSLARLRADYLAGNRNRDLVLTDVDDGTSTPQLSRRVLDHVSPFLPGGPTPAFRRVYVGTIGEPSCGNRRGITAMKAECSSANMSGWNPYVQGITDSAVTAAHIALSAQLATVFRRAYPTVAINWYISWEGFLPTLMRNDQAGIASAVVRAAYVAYFAALSRVLNTVQPSGAYLWSPALDQPLTQVQVDGQYGTYQANMVSFFQTVRSSAPAITSLRVVVQDGLSRSCLLLGGSYNQTTSSRIIWSQNLRAFATSWLSVGELNAELFTDPACPADGASSAVIARVAQYQNANVPIGTSFDLLSWEPLQ